MKTIESDQRLRTALLANGIFSLTGGAVALFLRGVVAEVMGIGSETVLVVAIIVAGFALLQGRFNE